MSAISDFFAQAYWWLSLLGGLHCLLLAAFVLFFHLEQRRQKLLLSAIFMLMALYFFTGLFNKGNIPTPLHLWFLLLIPTYFLLLPLVYLYCRLLLTPEKPVQLSSLHFVPMLLAMISVVTVFHFQRPVLTEWLLIDPLSPLNGLALLLPLALSLQTMWYMLLMLRLLLRHSRQHHLAEDRLIQLRFNWLLLLTLALIINWLVRNSALLLPVFLGDQLFTLAKTIPQAVLLLTIYGLAIYGLKQLTYTAYLRGKAAVSPPTPEIRNEILDEEERRFIEQMFHHQQDREP